MTDLAFVLCYKFVLLQSGAKLIIIFFQLHGPFPSLKMGRVTKEQSYFIWMSMDLGFALSQCLNYTRIHLFGFLIRMQTAAMTSSDNGTENSLC